MTTAKPSVRLLSPHESLYVARQSLGLYNTVTVGAVYEFSSSDADFSSAKCFVAPLKACVDRYPLMSAVVKDREANRPFFESVSKLDLQNHVTLIRDDDDAPSNDNVASTIERLLPQIHDQPLPQDAPEWRIDVLPLPPREGGSDVKRCLIFYVFSHATGDGMCGLSFHKAFLSACQNGAIPGAGAGAGAGTGTGTGTGGTETEEREERTTTVISVPSRPLTEPFDTAERLPVSWSFLIRPLITFLLPKFIADMLGLKSSPWAENEADASTWTSTAMFCEPAPIRTCARVLEIEAPLLARALRAGKSHGVRLTATLNLLFTRALSKTLRDLAFTNFAVGTVLNSRPAIGLPPDEWGNFASLDLMRYPRVGDPTGPIPAEDWAAAAAATKRFAESAAKRSDHPTALLRYVPSFGKWLQDQIGGPRTVTLEMSNLGAFDGAGEAGSPGKAGNNPPPCRITKLVFSQAANAVGSTFVANVASAKGGGGGEGLICAFTWQEGALGLPVEEEISFVEEILSSLRADIERLS